ncbi:MAG: molybdenum cofactor guanylyltransferase [Cyanobacteria bacterium P01_A01_bin.84]
MKNISTLILAGGKSSRMGCDKALVEYQGKPMLQRVYEVANACTEKVYVLTPWYDDPKEILCMDGVKQSIIDHCRYKKILPLNCNYLTESQPGNGALHGLYEGLEQISAEWVLLLACDLPLLDTKVIQEWINDLKQVPEDILAVVPKNSSNWEPMCAFYRYQALTQLQNFLQTGGRSFQKWFSHIKVQALPITPEVKRMLHNCNTPGDLKHNQN